PIHLLDIKRVAFETKPVNAPKASEQAMGTGQRKRPIRREDVAAIVDQFLSKKLAEMPEKPQEPTSKAPEPPPVEAPTAPESPVRTVIHELRNTPVDANGADRTPVDFVSESDVRDAIAKGRKIYITSKTILTPSARDLGEEKEVFARV